MTLYIIISLIAYLLGSIPFGLLLVRLFRKEDIRNIGSGNIGATNVIRSGAKGLGAATFILDGLKGYVAVILADTLMHGSSHGIPPLQNAAALAALFAVLGHMFPVWLGFKGGKGVATALGVTLALSPLAALVAFASFIVVFALSKYVSLASILAVIVFPIFAILVFRTQRTLFENAVICILPLLVIVKHHNNIARLAKGTEYRFGKPKPSTV
jgi:glycerol-3-phosphate acyltransferase PlsY